MQTPDQTLPATRRAEFLAGVKATLPLAIGAIPFAIIFGALAVTNGLSPAGAAAMSAFVFAGSAQFVASSMVAGGVPALIIVLTTFVVNVRHALYATSLAPYVKHLPQRWLLPLGFALTDESFMIVIQHYEQPGPAANKHWYFFGSNVLMYFNWQFWTWVGIFAGRTIPDPSRWGLDFAMTVTFVYMLLLFVRTRPALVACIVAGVVALLANGLPNKLGLIVAALLGVGAGLLAQILLGEQPASPTPRSEQTEVTP